MANETLATGNTLLAVPTGGGTSDGKVKINVEDNAGYLLDKLYSSNSSVNFSVLPDQPNKISVTVNNDYEAVISPATIFPILSCNGALTLPNHSVGIGSLNGYVTKINLPSGQVGSIALFGGQTQSTKHLSVALYGSDTDDIRTSKLFASVVNKTSESFLFDIAAAPMKIAQYKFYWVLFVLSAESSGGDAVNTMKTAINGAGIGEWCKQYGIGIVGNPFSSGSAFKDDWDYDINYNDDSFPYLQLNIIK